MDQIVGIKSFKNCRFFLLRTNGPHPPLDSARSITHIFSFVVNHDYVSVVICRPAKPFSEWDTENICDWLQDMGLDQYISEARRWIQNGQQLQEAPVQEIEKELGIKNSLHRKKLQLAIIDTQENGSSDPFLNKAGKLDTAWVRITYSSMFFLLPSWI